MQWNFSGGGGGCTFFATLLLRIFIILYMKFAIFVYYRRFIYSVLSLQNKCFNSVDNSYFNVRKRKQKWKKRLLVLPTWPMFRHVRCDIFYVQANCIVYNFVPTAFGFTAVFAIAKVHFGSIVFLSMNLNPDSDRRKAVLFS